MEGKSKRRQNISLHCYLKIQISNPLILRHYSFERGSRSSNAFSFRSRQVPSLLHSDSEIWSMILYMVPEKTGWKTNFEFSLCFLFFFKFESCFIFVRFNVQLGGGFCLVGFHVNEKSKSSIFIFSCFSCIFSETKHDFFFFGSEFVCFISHA